MAGLHARAVVKPEADKRPQIAHGLKSRAAQLVKDFKGTKIASYDKWDFNTLPTEQPAAVEWFTALAQGLTKKTGGMDVGFGWSLGEALRLERAELLDAFRELEPLYRIIRAVV